MREELNTYERIERYLNNQLTGQELADFKSRMASDASFFEEVNSQRLLTELIVDRGLLDLKKKLQKLDSPNANSNAHWKILSGIFAVGVVATIGFWAMPEKRETNIETAPTIEEKIKEPDVQRNDLEVIEKNSVVVNKKITISPKEKADLTPKATDHNTSSTLSTSNRILSSDVTEIDEKPLIEEKKIVEEALPVPVTHEDALKSVPCTLNKSLIKVLTMESCSDTPTGQITISKTSVFSGRAPFVFSIDRVHYRTDYTFSDLSAGAYSLSVKDATGCSWADDTPIHVGEKNCRSYEYAFDPDKQEVWKFPLPNNVHGKIEIYSRSGALVYTSEIINNYPDSWNGLTTDMEPLPMGSYTFILKSSDQVVSGSVTLIK